MDERDLKAGLAKARTVVGRLDEIVVGESVAKRILVTGLLTGGHVLVEALPGTGKTLLCRALAGALGGSFGRVQCTPDLLPTDVTGGDILTHDGQVKFREGPVFSNILLVDEINRTGPKTQSALLEAMQERKVTYGGRTYPLPDPFLVIATQNPIEMEGTYPLPEAQLDRFAYRVSMGGLNLDDYKAILKMTASVSQESETAPVISIDNALSLIKIAEAISVPEEVMAYSARLVMACDPARSPVKEVRENVRFGVSIRAAQSMIRGARVAAFLDGRPAAGFEDIRDMASFAVPHRIALNFSALAAGKTQAGVLEAVLKSVAPAEDV